jgi:hypothetical protein
MRIKPWLAVEKDYSAETIGKIMSAYYGGRAEVHRRREIVETRYCDFASMYPTNCSLMNLWDFVRSDGVTEHDATVSTRELLSKLKIGQLQDQDFWLKLRVLVEVKPNADIFPVRARYGEGPSHTIGVNYLSADRTLWFTLADCIASTLLTGKAPAIVSAIRFEPKAMQSGLRPVQVVGTDHTVDPRTDDFYRRVINIRRGVKIALAEAEARQAPKSERDRLDTKQLALKILANATSYGVFIELNVEGVDDGGANIVVHGAGDVFGTNTAKIEKPGNYFHPLLATLITGAARLMLAITESLATERGLDWLFCDTDSMAFAKPDLMSRDVFKEKVGGVCDWFKPLNPYEEKGSILEMEKQNYAKSKGPNGEKLEKPLFGFAVSAKRYALFNVERKCEILIRKASAHGLGHLLPPYREVVAEDAEDHDPPERESGVALWQEHVWGAIIGAARDGHPRKVVLDWHPALNFRAASQHTASTPDLLRGLGAYNEDKLYPERIKPFGFMLWYHAKRSEDRAWSEDQSAVLWNPRERQPKPASPYRRDPADVPGHLIFDRDTSEIVPKSWLRSYADVLRAYHRSPETKFIGGGGHEIGPLRRRHVFADPIFYIGKEADAFEEAEEFGEDEESVTLYGAAPIDREAMAATISAAPVAKLKIKARVGHALIARAALNDADVSNGMMLKIYKAALALSSDKLVAEKEAAALFQWAKAWAEQHSQAELARRLDCDPANLRAGFRKEGLGNSLSKKLKQLKEDEKNN